MLNQDQGYQQKSQEGDVRWGIDISIVHLVHSIAALEKNK